MTVETKTSIELSDIKAIEFECKGCGHSSSWPLDAVKNPPIDCASCGRPQWMPHGGDTYAELTKLLALLKRYGASTNEPYILRLVLTGNKEGH